MTAKPDAKMPTMEQIDEYRYRILDIVQGLACAVMLDQLCALAKIGRAALDADKLNIGDMRENSVVWYGGNPHSFPEGTKFYAVIPKPAVQS